MTTPKDKHNPTRNGHCSGCTDPQSEGTHQMGTFEHPDEAPKDKSQAEILAEKEIPWDQATTDALGLSYDGVYNTRDIARAGFVKGYAAGQAAQWVPVEERLPEPMVSVLVRQQYDADAFIASIRTTKYGKSSKPYWYAQLPDAGSVDGDGCWDGEVDEAFAKVTHWMPIPPPPSNT